MRFAASALAFVLLSAGVTGAETADSAAELTKLEGRWLVGHRAYTPSKANEEVAKLLTDLGHQVEIKDGKLSTHDPEKEGHHLVVAFHPSGNPKAVDLKVPGQKDKVFRGIYRVEDGVLSLVVGTDKERPTTFTASGDQVLLVLTRPRKP